MELNEDLVRKVAKLARLEISDDEAKLYQEQLSKIIKTFEEINEIHDTLGSNWRADTQAAELCLERADVAVTTINQNDLLAPAREKSGTAFVVPRIIES